MLTCPEHSGVVQSIKDMKESIDRVENKVDAGFEKLDGRIWTMALKVAGISATIGAGTVMAIHSFGAK